MVRLLFCDLKDQDSSYKNSLFKYLIKEEAAYIGPPIPRIGESLVNWVSPFLCFPYHYFNSLITRRLWMSLLFL